MNRKTIRYISLCVVALLVSILALTVQAQTTTAGENGFDVSGIYTDMILDEADIFVSENDKVVRTDGKGCIALTIIRAFEVKVDYRGQVIEVECTDGTVADAIKKAGITLTGAEEIVPSVNTPLAPMMEIKVASNCSAKVTIGGETAVYNVT